TAATICASLQLMMLVAAILLKEMVLNPCDVPKPFPLTVTCVLTGPALGEKESTNKLATVKFDEVPAMPPTVTFTAPVAVPDATVPVIRVSDQLLITRFVEPMAALLLPWFAPNPRPLICTWAPTAPPVGVKLQMTGFGS